MTTGARPRAVGFDITEAHEIPIDEPERATPRSASVPVHAIASAGKAAWGMRGNRGECRRFGAEARSSGVSSAGRMRPDGTAER